MKEYDPMKNAQKISERTLYEVFGPNPTVEVIDLNNRACIKSCQYTAYLNSFVPTVEQPYPLSDTEYFKQKEKDAE